MQTISLIWGILALIGTIVGLFPCFGSLNWFNIPFSFIGLIISIIALSGSNIESKSASVVGIIFCVISILFGIFRLILGGGLV
ncbi:MAG TPA: hypothetical protein PLX23_01375 [Candidatus Hydrogenedens sp.]|nr:hypothetical protein [Candidatus Hydrogenedens sp.]